MSISTLQSNLSVVASLPVFAPNTSYVLPGDLHAGRDLAASAEAWSTGGRTVFVRLRVVTPLDAHVAVLEFDAGGFGTLVSSRMAAGTLPTDIAAVLDGADQVVLLTDTDGPMDTCLSATVVERRDFARVRMFEQEVLGLRRTDCDLDPEVWSAARTGDPVAETWLMSAAQADLFALVAMAGGNVTLH